MAFQAQQHRTKRGLSLTTPSSNQDGFGLTLSFLHRAFPPFLHLSNPNISSLPIDLQESAPFPLGRERFLDLKTGKIYWEKESEMSRNGKNPKLDLKLNLSPPRANRRIMESPTNRSVGSSSPSSCVSTELNVGPDNDSPEATSMVLAGCPRCLMYVMLSEEDPKCPKCKSTVLLDFLHDNNNTKKKNKN
ncbi:uncharacterized protein LOC143876628 [Tasmannia lanceolata]|uniref:uncharacterized protein LOC143876628 n=1 Tax=Tasmannia lanceolata TaxID=3420 RepID=UPI004062B53E